MKKEYINPEIEILYVDKNIATFIQVSMNVDSVFDDQGTSVWEW